MLYTYFFGKFKGHFGRISMYKWSTFVYMVVSRASLLIRVHNISLEIGPRIPRKLEMMFRLFRVC